MVDILAIIVFAGYKWAKERNFDTLFNKGQFEEDRQYAIQILKKIYDGKSLSDVIEVMISRQEEIIRLRRLKEGYSAENDINGDVREEAKNYVTFLFFEDIVKDCVESNKCPDFLNRVIKREDKIVIDLFNSLIIDKYCCIKAYLRFIDRNNSLGFGPEIKIEGYENEDYLFAMSFLDRAFNNCKGDEKKSLNESINSYLKSSGKNRLVRNESDVIKQFVQTYYSFLKNIGIGKGEKEGAIEALKEIYKKENSKIANMLEFILKCVIVSYVKKEIHNDIRKNEGEKGII